MFKYFDSWHVLNLVKHASYSVTTLLLFSQTKRESNSTDRKRDINTLKLCYKKMYILQENFDDVSIHELSDADIVSDDDLKLTPRHGAKQVILELNPALFQVIIE